MKDIREHAQPINHRVIDKLKPSIDKMLHDMGVQYAEWEPNRVTFKYLDLHVTIETKSKRVTRDESKSIGTENRSSGLAGRHGNDL